ncbi:MAG: dihydropteroate synthase [Patescibacteria group bacterium]|nr:dihydropteroate synthase [Patescibacteria group bacterium]
MFNLKTPIILGILNVTPDSFSDGGKFLSLDFAIKRAEEMISQGANLIDVGGESTRPGGKSISAEEELQRVLPVVKKLHEMHIKISLDSRHPEVVSACLPFIDWINDVSGLSNSEMRRLVAESKKPIIIMHSTDLPVIPDKVPDYKDIITDLKRFFHVRIKSALEAGVNQDQIILDPGIGFGKNLQHNLTVISRISELSKLGYPICLGTSRKSFISKIDGSDAQNRLGGSLASVLFALEKGVKIFRVHDVQETVQAIRVWEEITLAKRKIS